MNKQNNELYKVAPQVVDKGWGHEKIIVNNDEYCGKILFFNKGATFSSHFHVKKLETFYCLKGYLKVEGINTTDATPCVMFLRKGEILNVPRLAIHKITALEESEIVEFSTHHDDSDSYRVAPGDSQK